MKFVRNIHSYHPFVCLLLVMDLFLLLMLGGMQSSIKFLLVTILMVVPMAVVIGRAAFSGVTANEKLSTAGGFFVLMVLLVPIYLLRKLTDNPQVFDLVIILLSLVALFRTSRQGFGDWRRSWSFATGKEYLYIVSALLLMFNLVWLGYEVHVEDKVRFYGLFTVDFGNLVSVVSLLRIGDFLPQVDTSIAEQLYYHWFYFVFPAFFSEFLGWQVDSSTALIISNFLVAAFFAVLMIGFVEQNQKEQRGSLAIVTAVTIVIFAPTVVYFYQKAVEYFGVDWFSLGLRNHLLLSPINSLINFGNNIVAIAFILMAATIENGRERVRDGKSFVLTVLFMTFVIPYSITLFFSAALGFGFWFLYKRDVYLPLLKIPFFYISVCLSVSLMAIYYMVGILGNTPYKLVVSFDDFQFVQNVFFSLPITIIFVGFYFYKQNKPNIFIFLFLAALLVPSLLYVGGSQTGSADFSMKTGTLIPLVLAPLAAYTVFEVFYRPNVKVRMLLVVLIIFGIINTAAYTLQFLVYRIKTGSGQYYALSKGYFESLSYIRTISEKGSIILDPIALNRSDINTTLWLGQRRSYLAPKKRSMMNSPELLRRNGLWSDYYASDFSNEKIECSLAKGADWNIGGYFRKERGFDGYVVLRSLQPTACTK